MIYLFSVAAGLVGGFAAVLLLSGRRPRRRREGKQSRRKIECSKLVLWAVLCTYFAGFGVGVWAVVLDVSQLGVFLAYVGTPTATVIGFYSWKAKAENVVKIKKANLVFPLPFAPRMPISCPDWAEKDMCCTMWLPA